ncbi:hypothetical protein [Bacteroides sp. 51]|nr:hypothetical protein [Bacteroides sp. 51]
MKNIVIKELTEKELRETFGGSNGQYILIVINGELRRIRTK